MMQHVCTQTLAMAMASMHSVAVPGDLFSRDKGSEGVSDVCILHIHGSYHLWGSRASRRLLLVTERWFYEINFGHLMFL